MFHIIPMDKRQLIVKHTKFALVVSNDRLRESIIQF